MSPTTPATNGSPSAGAAAETSIAEALVSGLSATWRAIQARHPDVPDVVIALGAGTDRCRARAKLGHFASRQWVRPAVRRDEDGDGGADGRAEAAGEDVFVHELLVSGEGLALGPVEALGTLLHEAARARAEHRGIADTSDGGRYHNRRFAELAEDMGLHVADAGRRGGRAATTVPPATAETYRDQLEYLRTALTVHRLEPPPRRRGPGRPDARRRLRLPAAADGGASPARPSRPPASSAPPADRNSDSPDPRNLRPTRRPTTLLPGHGSSAADARHLVTTRIRASHEHRDVQLHSTRSRQRPETPLGILRSVEPSFRIP